MLQKEFESRIGFSVGPEFYHKYVEPEYNRSCENKDEWCQIWLGKQQTKEGVDNLIHTISTLMESSRTKQQTNEVLETAMLELKERLKKSEEQAEARLDKLTECYKDYDSLLEKKEALEKQVFRYKLLDGSQLSEAERKAIASYLINYD